MSFNIIDLSNFFLLSLWFYYFVPYFQNCSHLFHTSVYFTALNFHLYDFVIASSDDKWRLNTLQVQCLESIYILLLSFLSLSRSPVSRAPPPPPARPAPPPPPPPGAGAGAGAATSGGPSLMGQMAATAGGVAVGSAIVSIFFFVMRFEVSV